MDLRERLKRRIVTINSIAKDTGINYPYLTQYIKGKIDLGDKAKQKLIDWLDRQGG